MLRGEERKSDRNRRGKVFRTQGTISNASLCGSGGEAGVREEKKAGRGRRKGKREEDDLFPSSPASFLSILNFHSPIAHGLPRNILHKLYLRFLLGRL